MEILMEVVYLIKILPASSNDRKFSRVFLEMMDLCTAYHIQDVCTRMVYQLDASSNV